MPSWGNRLRLEKLLQPCICGQGMDFEGSWQGATAGSLASLSERASMPSFPAIICRQGADIDACEWSMAITACMGASSIDSISSQERKLCIAVRIFVLLCGSTQCLSGCRNQVQQLGFTGFEPAAGKKFQTSSTGFHSAMISRRACSPPATTRPAISKTAPGNHHFILFTGLFSSSLQGKRKPTIRILVPVVEIHP